MIKVLTLWEPYASLFIYDEKKYETRKAATSHTGTYLIHAAAKKMTRADKAMCETEMFASALNRIGIKDFSDFNPGCIIGAYQQFSCHRIVGTDETGFKLLNPILNIPGPQLFFKDRNISAKEVAFGDFQYGRYAWFGKEKRVFSNPFEYKGGQGYHVPFKGEKDDLLKAMNIELVLS
jgi:hypothetical protein